MLASLVAAAFAAASEVFWPPNLPALYILPAWNRRASFRLLSLIGTGRFEFALSTALMLEYEDAAKRQLDELVFTEEEVDRLLDILCAQAVRSSVFFLWRPTLPDPADDFVLELAVSSGAGCIVTYNKRDFVGAEHFGVRILDAKEFLRMIGEIP